MEIYEHEINNSETKYNQSDNSKIQIHDEIQNCMRWEDIVEKINKSFSYNGSPSFIIAHLHLW